MTVRPRRRELNDSVGELFDRMRKSERTGEGPWVYVGSGNPLPDQDGIAPNFQNGWDNVGGGLTPLRFKWLLAGGIEIQGSITGGADNTVVFTLPAGPFYLPDYELRFVALNDADGPVAMSVQTSGEVTRRTG